MNTLNTSWGSQHCKLNDCVKSFTNDTGQTTVYVEAAKKS